MILSSLEGHRTKNRTEHPRGSHLGNVYKLWELEAGLQVDISWKVDHTDSTVAPAADGTAAQEAGSKAADIVPQAVYRTRRAIEAADNTAERAGCIHRLVGPVAGADGIHQPEKC